MILRIYHDAAHAGDLQVGESAKLDELLEKVSLLLLVRYMGLS
jgi:hypothetical protein